MLTKISQHEIQCDTDGCEAAEVYEETDADAAEEQAVGDDWQIVDGRHYCPAHRQKEVVALDNNTERIERGRALLAGMYSDGDYEPHDAITDILHALHVDGIDTEAAIRMAVANFEAERDGEA